MKPLNTFWKQQKRLSSGSFESTSAQKKHKACKEINGLSITEDPSESQKNNNVFSFSNTFTPEDLLLIEELEQNNKEESKSSQHSTMVGYAGNKSIKSGSISNSQNDDIEKNNLITIEDDSSEGLELNHDNHEEQITVTNSPNSNEDFQSGIDPSLLSNWGLPWGVLQKYSDYGITSLFPWQVECLTLGNVLRGGNLVYSAPTSAGKTLVAEILLLKRVLETKKKAIVILPFVSVAREKMFYLQRLFQSAGIRVNGYIGTHYPPGGWKRIDVAVCTIEKANSLINRLLEEKKLHQIGIIVVDELHMLGDSSRGYLLELLLTKVQYMSWKLLQSEQTKTSVQIIGMSATLPNLDILSTWLKADLYKTEFRPVPLNEYVKVGNLVYNSQFQLVRELPSYTPLTAVDNDNIIQMCLETVSGNHSVLIFCPAKSWCEKLADIIAKEFHSLGRYSSEEHRERGSSDQHIYYGERLRQILSADDLKDVLEQLQRTPAGLDHVLSKTVCFGVAFHHAGLTYDERDIIEGAFRQNVIRVLVATSTLSSGVNLPARRVIVRSPMFYGQLIDVLVYRQMIGRAGRKGIDTEGEGFLICKKNEIEKATTLVNSSLKPIKSCLIRKNKNIITSSLKRAILEIVVSGVATSPAEIEQYYSCTLMAASLPDESLTNQMNNEENSVNPIKTCLKFLIENEFIILHVMVDPDGSEHTKYIPTPLGSAVMASSLSADEGLIVFKELDKARKSFVLENELHIIYQVTPLHISDQWTDMDWYNYLNIWEQLAADQKKVGELVGVEERFLVRLARTQNVNFTSKQYRQLAIHQRFFTALVLHDLVNEIPLHVVSKKFNCNRGMLQSLQQSASTFAGMVTSFCNRLGWINLELLLNQFQSRLNFGIQRELCDLVRLSLLNGQRARLLYDGGFTSISDIAHADSFEIETILRNAGPFHSKKQREDETNFELHERHQKRCIWITGQKGITEAEAATLLIEEAQQFVEKELGVNIQWNSSTEKSLETRNKETTERETNSFTLSSTPSESQDKQEQLNHLATNSDEQTKNAANDSCLAHIHKSPNEKQEKNMEKNNVEVIDLTCDSDILLIEGRISVNDDRTNTNSNKTNVDFSVEKCKDVTVNEKFFSVSNSTTNFIEDKLSNLTNKTSASSELKSNSKIENEINQDSINESFILDTQTRKLLDGNVSCFMNMSEFTSIEHKSQKRVSFETLVASPVLSTLQSWTVKSSTPNNNSSSSNTKHVSSIDKEVFSPIPNLEINTSWSKCITIIKADTKKHNENEGSCGSFASNNSINLFDSPPSSPVKNNENNILVNDKNFCTAPESSDTESDNETGILQLESLSDRDDNSDVQSPCLEDTVYQDVKFTKMQTKAKKINENDIMCTKDKLDNTESNEILGKCVKNKNVLHSLKPHCSNNCNNFDDNVTLPDDTINLLNAVTNISDLSYKPAPKRKRNGDIPVPDNTTFSFGCETTGLQNQNFGYSQKKNETPKSNVIKEISSRSESYDSIRNLNQKYSRCISSSNSRIRTCSKAHNGVRGNLFKNSRKTVRKVYQKLSRLKSTCEMSESQHISDYDSDESSTTNENSQTRKLTVRNSPNITESPTHSLNELNDSFYSRFFSVVDVCSSEKQFSSFIKIWKSTQRFGLSIACEKIISNCSESIGSKILGQNNGLDKNHQLVNTEEVSFEIRSKKLKIVGLAIYLEGTKVYYIPFDKANSAVPIAKCLLSIQTVLSQNMKPMKKVVAFDLKTQFRLLFFGCGIFPTCRNEDPKIADWLLDPSNMENNFYQLVLSHCEEKIVLLENIGGKYNNWDIGVPAFSSESAMIRAVIEAFLAIQVMDSLQQKLEEQQLLTVFQDIEMQTIQILLKTELNGIGFHRKYFQNHLEVMQTILLSLEKEAFRLAGRKFSMTSSKDVSKVLYSELKLHLDQDKKNNSVKIGNHQNLTAHRNLKTNHAALLKLSQVHPIPNIIILWRKISNSLSKIVLPLLKDSRLSPSLNMDRIYGSFQHFTATGRIAMHEPNLQAIPKTFEVEKQTYVIENQTFTNYSDSCNPTKFLSNHIYNSNSHPSQVGVIALRDAFVPFEGGILLSADYSQLELRILAHLSGDPYLLNILNNDGDVFKMVAAQLKGRSVDAINSDDRQSAKQICYGIIYGMGAKALGDQLGVDEEDATAFIENFKSKFPGVKSYIQDVLQNCQKNEYVETLMKRRRYLPAIQSKNSYSRSHAERQAVNTTIQGSAADLVKAAVIKIDKEIRRKFPLTEKPLAYRCGRKLAEDECSTSRKKTVTHGGYLVLQIHDELLYEIFKEDLQVIARLIKDEMENVIKLKVKMRVNIKCGPSWGKLKPMEFS